MGKLHLDQTGFEDLFVIETTSFFDHRGNFIEVYNKRDFEEIGITKGFLQDNQAISRKGVLRGLHFQHKFPQVKLVRVVLGEVFDVAVDLRQNSKTFGKWFGIILSEDNNKMVYIPEGFAHGYLVLSDNAVFHYKCSEYYHPDDQFGIMWNDPDINIFWPLSENEIILSEQDKSWGRFKNLDFFIKGLVRLNKNI